MLPLQPDFTILLVDVVLYSPRAGVKVGHLHGLTFVEVDELGDLHEPIIYYLSRHSY